MQFNDLVNRVIRQESGGNPNAVNASSGASGLMQIMPATAADPGFGVQSMDWDKRFDANENRRFGTEYLTAMLNRYDGNEARALAAYNWGVGNADKWDGSMSSLPEETRGYLTNILGGEAGPAYSTVSSSPQPNGLTQAMALKTQPAETLKLFGWDTGATESDLATAVEALKVPEIKPMQAMQRPQAQPIQRADGLARALAAHQATKQRRA